MQKINVKPITEKSFMVGKKIVYQDLNSNWISISKLSKYELKAYARYKKEILDLNVVPLLSKTYKILKFKKCTVSDI